MPKEKYTLLPSLQRALAELGENICLARPDKAEKIIIDVVNNSKKIGV